MKDILKKKVAAAAACAFLLLALSLPGFSQQAAIRPVSVGQPMPDFTLPVYQGGSLTLSSLKGKNVILMFPRGYAAEGAWCTICNYKYAELVDLEQAREIRKKYNAEILVVLPYSADIVKQWLDVVPAQLEKIKRTKNPAEPDKLDEKGKTSMARYRMLFPKDLSMKPGEVPTPFPILVDADRTVSKGLGLFMTEWSGSKVDQNIPTYYIVDKNGVVQFKYLSQNTADRPDYEYLFKILDWINKGM
jgi:peroxiredoxin